LTVIWCCESITQHQKKMLLFLTSQIFTVLSHRSLASKAAQDCALFCAALFAIRIMSNFTIHVNGNEIEVTEAQENVFNWINERSEFRYLKEEKDGFMGFDDDSGDTQAAAKMTVKSLVDKGVFWKDPESGYVKHVHQAPQLVSIGYIDEIVCSQTSDPDRVVTLLVDKRVTPTNRYGVKQLKKDGGVTIHGWVGTRYATLDEAKKIFDVVSAVDPSTKYTLVKIESTLGDEVSLSSMVKAEWQGNDLFLSFEGSPVNDDRSDAVLTILESDEGLTVEFTATVDLAFSDIDEVKKEGAKALKKVLRRFVAQL